MLSSKTVTFFTEENLPLHNFLVSHLLRNDPKCKVFSSQGLLGLQEVSPQDHITTFSSNCRSAREVCHFCAGDFSTHMALCQWVLDGFCTQDSQAQKTTSPQSNDTSSSTANVLQSLWLLACPNISWITPGLLFFKAHGEGVEQCEKEVRTLSLRASWPAQEQGCRSAAMPGRSNISPRRINSKRSTSRFGQFQENSEGQNIKQAPQPPASKSIQHSNLDTHTHKKKYLSTAEDNPQTLLKSLSHGKRNPWLHQRLFWTEIEEVPIQLPVSKYWCSSWRFFISLLKSIKSRCRWMLHLQSC